jgi:hypothetical protein
MVDWMVVNVSQAGRLRGLRALCVNCRHWRPSPHYAYAGYCPVLGRVTLEDDSCGNYSPLDLSRRGFYWCSSCKTRVPGE